MLLLIMSRMISRQREKAGTILSSSSFPVYQCRSVWETFGDSLTSLMQMEAVHFLYPILLCCFSSDVHSTFSKWFWVSFLALDQSKFGKSFLSLKVRILSNLLRFKMISTKLIHLSKFYDRYRIRTSFGYLVRCHLLLCPDGFGFLLPVLVLSSRSSLDCLQAGMDYERNLLLQQQWQ